MPARLASSRASVATLESAFPSAVNCPTELTRLVPAGFCSSRAFPSTQRRGLKCHGAFNVLWRDLSLARTSALSGRLPLRPTYPKTRLVLAPNETPAREQLAEGSDLATLKRLDRSLEGRGVKNLDEITFLNLSFTSVKDNDMSAVGKARHLTSLELRATSITDSGLKRISGLGGIELLDLAETGVTDESLISLRTLQSIAVLELDQTDVGNRAPAPLWPSPRQLASSNAF